MILVTGFAPFLGQKVNPSWELAKALESEFSGTVQGLLLPVEFGRAFEVLKQYVNTLNEFPKFILLLGQAQGRTQVCLERVALNWIETVHPDESGVLHPVGAIEASSAPAFIQQWSFKKEDLPAEIKISHSAGTYVCNELYFRTISYFDKNQTQIAFVHVPLIPEQAKPGEPALPLSQQFETLKAFVKTLEAL